jgi:hypothetical protein
VTCCVFGWLSSSRKDPARPRCPLPAWLVRAADTGHLHGAAWQRGLDGVTSLQPALRAATALAEPFAHSDKRTVHAAVPGGRLDRLLAAQNGVASKSQADLSVTVCRLLLRLCSSLSTRCSWTAESAGWRRRRAPQFQAGEQFWAQAADLRRLDEHCLTRFHGLARSHLQRLDLESYTLGPRSALALDLSLFSLLLTASGTPRLPHLSALQFPVEQNYCDDLNDPLQREREQAFTTTNKQIVAAYSAQLTYLSVTLLIASSVDPWMRVLARCSRLFVLHILGAIRCEPAQLQFTPALADEEWLLHGRKRLWPSSLPLTDNGVLSLFSHFLSWRSVGCPKCRT